jgi:hypothetical protein
MSYLKERGGDLAPFQPVGFVTRTDKLDKTGISLEISNVATSKIKPSGELANVLFLEKGGGFFHLS